MTPVITTTTLLLVLCWLSSLSLVRTSSSDNASSGSSKPNIVLLFMDDLGYGDPGFNGHPTTETPNLDSLARGGKVLTTWYSGCMVCTGSRAAIMTGRQFLRTGLPGVLGPTEPHGLPLGETTIASHLKQEAGYATAAVGKWHLGQRLVYLPSNRGFDYYLGIPYSDDMGSGRQSPCGNGTSTAEQGGVPSPPAKPGAASWSRDLYEKLGLCSSSEAGESTNNDQNVEDPAGLHLPLVYQEHNRTRIVEQPLDFTTLALKYNDFITRFLKQQSNSSNPFFLYVPFSHVHTTRNTPEKQYAGCRFRNSTRRGAFGDALAEADWIVGNLVRTLREFGAEENTILLFASDNGPWLVKGSSAGSVGLLTGRYSGYWDTGKGSTWEGGIRSPAFAYWKGTIPPGSRTSEVVSSLDVFPTLSVLAGVPLPPDTTMDGKDMSDVLLKRDGKSQHEFLFFYSTCDDRFPTRPNGRWGVAAVRHGRYKAHWCTGPGLSGIGEKRVYLRYPLMFDVDQDPSESLPINENGTMPTDPDHAAAMTRILKAYAFEIATFSYGTNVPEPDGPGEGPGTYGLCCDRSRNCNCAVNGVDESTATTTSAAMGLFNIGTKRHHDTYHAVLGEEEPFPPRARAQASLHQNG